MNWYVPAKQLMRGWGVLNACSPCQTIWVHVAPSATAWSLLIAQLNCTRNYPFSSNLRTSPTPPHSLTFPHTFTLSIVRPGVLPIVCVGMVVQANAAISGNSEANKMYAASSQAAAEAFSSIRVVFSYNLQGYVYDAYTAMLVRGYRVGRGC